MLMIDDCCCRIDGFKRKSPPPTKKSLNTLLGLHPFVAFTLQLTQLSRIKTFLQPPSPVKISGSTPGRQPLSYAFDFELVVFHKSYTMS